jgi:NRPS condensation-like uncharacterized protein
MSQRIQATVSDMALECSHENTSSQNINLVITLEGKVNIERLKKAVQLLINAEEILGCRFVKHPIRPFWEAQPRLSRKDFLEGYCCAIEATDLEAAAEAFSTESIDPSTHPLLQVRVFLHPDNPIEIVVIKLSHLVGDGAAIFRCSQYLIQIYAKLATDPNFKPIRNTRSRGIDQITKRFTNKEKLQIVRFALAATKRRDAATNKYKFPNPPASPEQRMFLRKEIPPEQVQALKGYGRRHGATLNLVLMTAYFRSICANIPLQDSGVLPLASTVDLRRYLPETERSQIPLCNLSGLIVLLSGVPTSGTFAETLKLFKEQMKERKANYFGLLMLPLVLALYRGLPYFLGQRIARNNFAKAKKSNTTVPVLSNVGELKAEDYKFGDLIRVINIYVLPPVMYSPSFFSSVTEFRQTITLATGFSQTLLPRKTVEAIFECMAMELSELADEYLRSSKTPSRKNAVEVLDDA